jgi:hypothetical protein
MLDFNPQILLESQQIRSISAKDFLAPNEATPVCDTESELTVYEFDGLQWLFLRADFSNLSKNKTTGKAK